MRVAIAFAAASGRGDRRPPGAVGCEHAVEAGEIYARLGHERGQPGDHRPEHPVGGAIAIRGLQAVVEVALRRQRQPLGADGRASDAQALLWCNITDILALLT